MAGFLAFSEKSAFPMAQWLCVLTFHNGDYSSGHCSGLSPDSLSTPVEHRCITKSAAKVQHFSDSPTRLPLFFVEWRKNTKIPYKDRLGSMTAIQDTAARRCLSMTKANRFHTVNPLSASSIPKISEYYFALFYGRLKIKLYFCEQ